MKYRVMRETSYQIPISIELLFDNHGDLFGLSPELIYVYGWPLWLAREWFKRLWCREDGTEGQAAMKLSFGWFGLRCLVCGCKYPWWGTPKHDPRCPNR